MPRDTFVKSAAMAEASYRVQTMQGLSKHYSLDELRKRKADGLVDDAAKCTPDDGDTWSPLGMLLSTYPESGDQQHRAARNSRHKAQRSRKQPESARTDEAGSGPSESLPFARLAGHKYVTRAVIGMGLTAIFALGWSASKMLRGPSPPRFNAKSIEGRDTLSPAELSAKVTEIESRLVYIQSTIPSMEQISRKLDFEAGEKPALPLLGYIPRSLTPDEQLVADDRLARYSRLVREQGANGRRLDSITVRTYSNYLVELIELIDSERPDRAAATMKLAELTKFIYLLQLKNTRGSDVAAAAEAEQLILESANRGLRKLFVELRTGDARFADVLNSARPREQAGLVLIRYWFYRARSIRAADQWLAEMLTHVDSGQHAEIHKSISEVNGIE